MKRITYIVALLLCCGQVRADITTSIVGLWKFDEGTGTSAADSSGNGRTGTLTDGPTWATGKIGPYAVTCDGTNDFVDVAHAAAFNFGAHTLAAWIKPPAVSAAPAFFINKRDGGGAFFQFWRRVASADTLLHYYNGTTVFDSDSSVPDGVWSHVAVTHDGASTLKFYLNGALNGTQTVSLGPTNSANISLMHDGLSGYAAGTIDDVRIYSRALSAGDITELYAYTSVKSALLYYYHAHKRPARYRQLVAALKPEPHYFLAP